VSVNARRIPIAAELHVDLRLRVGAIRLGIAPVAELWVSRTTGTLHDGTTVFAEPGLSARAAYRIDIGRVGFAFGIDLTGVFTPENLTIDGLGRVARTSAIQLAPYLAGGVRL
jgi:hypothetical protein